ncbi:MAG: hypothetical protein V2A56_09435 [bacterium]
MAPPISGEMELEDLAAQNPKAIGLLTRRNIVCIRCGTPLWKTVEEAIHDAGIEDTEKVIEEVNRELASL